MSKFETLGKTDIIGSKTKLRDAHSQLCFLVRLVCVQLV